MNDKARENSRLGIMLSRNLCLHIRHRAHGHAFDYGAIVQGHAKPQWWRGSFESRKRACPGNYSKTKGSISDYVAIDGVGTVEVISQAHMRSYGGTHKPVVGSSGRLRNHPQTLYRTTQGVE